MMSQYTGERFWAWMVNALAVARNGTYVMETRKNITAAMPSGTPTTGSQMFLFPEIQLTGPT